MITVLHGQDNFRSHNKLRELVRVYQEKHGHTNNVFHFDASETDFYELKNAMHSGTLFTNSRLVVIRELNTNDALRGLFIEHLLRNAVNDQDASVVLFEGLSMGTERAYFTILASATKVYEFKALTAAGTAVWLADQFPQAPYEVIKSVAQICGADTARAYNEIKKLMAFKTPSALSKNDLSVLGVYDEEARIFKAVDAIFSQRKDRALYQLLLLFKTGAAPEYVFAMLERQLKLLALIKDSTEKGGVPAVLAKELGLHPFVVQKTLALSNRFSWQRLRELYKRVESLDVRAKSGVIEPTLACELLAVAVASS